MQLLKLSPLTLQLLSQSKCWLIDVTALLAAFCWNSMLVLKKSYKAETKMHVAKEDGSLGFYISALFLHDL